MTREYPNDPIVGVGGVILSGNRILLVKRAQEPGKGRWSIPGGLVNLGETTKDAVRREIKEETNLDIIVGDLAGIFDFIKKDEKNNIKYHYVIIDYFAKNFKGNPKPSSDAIELKWVDINQIENLELTSTTKLLIQKIEK